MTLKATYLRFMTSPLRQIEEQARSLSAEDRAKLAERMLESLHASLEEIETAWSEEVAFRIQAFANGDISAVSAEQIFAEARQILK
ncbi:MAG: addiction module protein [Cyanobacteriota bacterium]|jgi:putative addiction module component (TIGR02574 family)